MNAGGSECWQASTKAGKTDSRLKISFFRFWPWFFTFWTRILQFSEFYTVFPFLIFFFWNSFPFSNILFSDVVRWFCCWESKFKQYFRRQNQGLTVFYSAPILSSSHLYLWMGKLLISCCFNMCFFLGKGWMKRKLCSLLVKNTALCV